MHNCALRVKAKYPAVDDHIACVKAATVTNKTRQAMFEAFGKPPQPITTRWASWLQAAFYYATIRPYVRDIVDRFEGSGLLVERAKVSINAQSLPQDLMKINKEYKSLASLVLQIEDTKYTIRAAYNDLTKLGFGDDSCAIAAYIRKRLEKNDLSEIMAMNR